LRGREETVWDGRQHVRRTVAETGLGETDKPPKQCQPMATLSDTYRFLRGLL
jgi:hypothetical protein